MYTVKEVLGKDLKVNDNYWSVKELRWVSVTQEKLDRKDYMKDTIFLVKVSNTIDKEEAKPMTLEEAFKKWYNELPKHDVYDGMTTKIIGTCVGIDRETAKDIFEAGFNSNPPHVEDAEEAFKKYMDSISDEFRFQPKLERVEEMKKEFISIYNFMAGRIDSKQETKDK